MRTLYKRTTIAAVLLTAVAVQSASAQRRPNTRPVSQPARLPSAPVLRRVPQAQPVANRYAAPVRRVANQGAAAPSRGYGRLNAPLNPTPRANIPYQVGGTMITNQAFHPAEMLYPHRYQAMYPPYYYKVHGGWRVTPWGVRSYEHWKLMGTKVDVKYHGSISPLAGFTKPFLR